MTLPPAAWLPCRAAVVALALALLASGAAADPAEAGARSGDPEARATLPDRLREQARDGQAEPLDRDGRLSPQIVGGSVAAPGAWPWAAYLELVSEGSGFPERVCTGSLIGSRWVLTAAHCVAEPDGSVPAGRAVRVSIGEEDLTLVSDEVTYLSDQLYLGAWNRLVSRAHDLALVRLDRPAGGPALQLVRPGDEELWAPGTLATAVGWGDTSEGGFPSFLLREAVLPIVADEECAASYGEHFVPEAMLCAGYPEGGVDVCSGDSGGPLMVPSGLGGWLQAGITSFGRGCAQPGSPGVYVRVASYVDQILATVAADPVAPAGAPRAATGRAQRVKRTAARVRGTVRPNGLATSFFVELGPTRRYGHLAHLYAGAGRNPVRVRATFTGLRPGRRYHYRVSAWNAAGFVSGPDRTFRTRR